MSVTLKISNKHLILMGCQPQLAWKCLFALTFFGERFWPVK